MKTTTKLFRIFSDETKQRMLLLLDRQELCVSQIKGILGISQSLASRDLAQMHDAGIITERRAGKLLFYRINEGLERPAAVLMGLLKEQAIDDKIVKNDYEVLQLCRTLVQKDGACDIQSFLLQVEKIRRKINT